MKELIERVKKIGNPDQIQMVRELNILIKDVSENIEKMKFNVAIASLWSGVHQMIEGKANEITVSFTKKEVVDVGEMLESGDKNHLSSEEVQRQVYKKYGELKGRGILEYLVDVFK